MQRKGPSSTDCQSRLGPSSPKMVRQDFILSAEKQQAGLSGRDWRCGKVFGLHLELGFAPETCRLLNYLLSFAVDL